MNSVEIVRHLCKEKRIPISKLERDLDFSNGYISQLRKGSLPSSRLSDIANYLDVSINYLLTGKDDEFTSAARGIARKAMNLSPENQKLVIQMIDAMERRGKEAKES